ncbi:MAG: glycosyltransferase family 2 protein [Thermodesulfobacteriota bacterium]
MTEPLLTFVIPAYNEAPNLAATLLGIQRAAAERGVSFEALIIDDGSGDGTGAIADGLAAEDPRIRVLHNPRNRGLGFNYTLGVQQAKGRFVMMVPGDNEVLPETVAELLGCLGRADIVVPYIANQEIRPLGRQLLSRLFTAGLNAAFGLKLRYYNGIVIHRADLVRSVPITTHGFAYQAEALVRLIRSGHSYVQAPMIIRERPGGGSKALRPRNVFSVLRTVAALLLDVRWRQRRSYAAPGPEVAGGRGGHPG